MSNVPRMLNLQQSQPCSRHVLTRRRCASVTRKDQTRCKNHICLRRLEKSPKLIKPKHLHLTNRLPKSLLQKIFLLRLQLHNQMSYPTYPTLFTSNFIKKQIGSNRWRKPIFKLKNLFISTDQTRSNANDYTKTLIPICDHSN